MTLADSRTILGTVVAKQANFYHVRLDSGLSLLCTRKARLKKIGGQVMVGDSVVVGEPDYGEKTGAISQILPRQTKLERPAMANAEQILLVFAFAEPDLDAHQLTRFLVKAESTQLAVSLCFNKQDLVTENKQEEWQARLESWGYKPLLISVAENKGIEALTSYLGDKITVLAGPSGVGKSSLINRLIPDLELRVSQVSGKLSRGRHTTRHVELFELPGGGFIADSPGFNQPDLHCAPADLVYYFPEAREKLAQGECQFSNCLHSHEPNCAVAGDWERYQFYLKFLAEAIAQEEIQRQKSSEESRLKLKIKSSGERHYEPKLETKKYRRRSRRSRNQNIQDFFEDNYED